MIRLEKMTDIFSNHGSVQMCLPAQNMVDWFFLTDEERARAKAITT